MKAEPLYQYTIRAMLSGHILWAVSGIDDDVLALYETYLTRLAQNKFKGKLLEGVIDVVLIASRVELDCTNDHNFKGVA